MQRPADEALPATEIAGPSDAPGAITDLTESPDDLFVRIRNGFCAMPNLTGDLVPPSSSGT